MDIKIEKIFENVNYFKKCLKFKCSLKCYAIA